MKYFMNYFMIFLFHFDCVCLLNFIVLNRCYYLMFFFLQMDQMYLNLVYLYNGKRIIDIAVKPIIDLSLTCFQGRDPLWAK
jgi:hypothetical protein